MMQQERRISLVLSMLFPCGSAGAAEDAKTKSFYEGPGILSTRPNETTSLQTIDRSDYLFVEAGGFSTRNPPGRKPPWYVLRRKTK